MTDKKNEITNIQEHDAKYQDQSNKNKTTIYTGPERRRPVVPPPQSLECAAEHCKLDSNIKSAKQYLILSSCIVGALLIIQVIGVVVLFFVLSKLQNMPDVIVHEIQDTIRTEHVEHELYVERVINDYENRQATKDISKDIKDMKSEIMKVIQEKHPIDDTIN